MKISLESHYEMDLKMSKKSSIKGGSNQLKIEIPDSSFNTSKNQSSSDYIGEIDF